MAKKATAAAGNGRTKTATEKHVEELLEQNGGDVGVMMSSRADIAPEAEGDGIVIAPDVGQVESVKTPGKRAAGTPAPVKPINLPRLEIGLLKVTVVGDSELICHAWSEKAKREILQKQMGEATAGREKKNPIEDFVQSLYILRMGDLVGDQTLKQRGPDGHPLVRIKGGRFGFPSVAFKNAMVEACTSTGKAITKVAARQSFHVNGEHVIIQGTPRCREDMVRLNGQTADIRFRGGFQQWAATLNIRYNARVLTAEQIVNLLNIAGFAVGVGEWRSERDGGFGLFHVAIEGEAETALAAAGDDDGPEVGSAGEPMPE